MPDDWENFIRSINPKRLEHERLGNPGPDERPGSDDEKLMLAVHEMNRKKFQRDANRADAWLVGKGRYVRLPNRGEERQT